jgi:peroxiredoxin
VGPIYKVEGIPSTYIIDKNGVIRFVHSGFPSDPESQKAEIDKMESEIKSVIALKERA